jgi:hypothetical protein
MQCFVLMGPAAAAAACRLDIAMTEQGNINIYEIYADVCSKGDSSSSAANAAGRQQQQQDGKYYGALLGQANPLRTGVEGRCC